MKGPVVLLGPPGAGKSTAGKRAAAQLGMRFVDLDDAIAPDVARLWADEGEASFRARELGALDAALDGSDVVVAAGAGCVDTAPGRALLRDRALCVALEAPLDTCLARLLADDVRRPWLLDAGAARDVLAKREQARPAHRGALALAHVDAQGAVDDVAARLAHALDELRPVPPALALPDVHFADDAVAHARALAGERRALFVVDDAVARLHGVPGDVVVPGGERIKALAHIEELAKALVQAGATRDCVVVAVGGGAVLDAAGLAAALLFRGVRWVSVPTTLLAQADAGIGGKTAVDVGGLKNVLGAFHAPVGTVIARSFLGTLSEAQLREGRAEMLKHEMLAADAPADGAARAGHADDGDDVRRSLSIKASVVGRDARERGLRALLNLGHTYAHALESARPGIGHGEAVRHGLLRMLELSRRHAGLSEQAASALSARVRALGPLVPVDDVDPAALSAALRVDKKGAGRWILLRAPGVPVVRTLPHAEIFNPGAHDLP